MAHLLYDPRFEHDACGIGFVARVDGQPTHEVVRLALEALGSLTHRGAVAADGASGDGAGLLTLIPRPLVARELTASYCATTVDRVGIGMIFGPQDAMAFEAVRAIVDEAMVRQGLFVLGWRPVPVNMAVLGPTARDSCPTIAQVLVARPSEMDDETFERRLYQARRRMEQAALQRHLDLYVPSCSCRTIVYKGLMLPQLLDQFYLDLADPDYAAAAAVYHQRYSTNTFPSWSRAQPFRIVSHNGEINTLAGNVNWMQAREPLLDSAVLPDVQSLRPIIDTDGSDSAQFDNVLELLVRAGRDVRHAMLMMVPEAWEQTNLPQSWRDFYAWHANLMEPWDGPAALTFCDGKIVGSLLDRNGLRPARYLITDDGLVVMGSEVGACQIAEERIVQKGRLGPGQMLAIDLERHTILDNHAIKSMLAKAQPYGEWLKESQVSLPPTQDIEPAGIDIAALQTTFGYTSEALAMVLKPMAQTGSEPIGSMGDDTPAAVLSRHGRSIFSYLKQRFAEVTNPPIDPLREHHVMSLAIRLGARHNLLAESTAHTHQIALETPILRDSELLALQTLNDPAFTFAALDATFPRTYEDDWIMLALDDLCAAADRAIDSGATLLIISDRNTSSQRIPIPSLLALGAVHHYLIRTGKRSTCSLIVESAEPHEVHHLAALIGYGAEAVNPYLALASVRNLATERSREPWNANDAEVKYCQALQKGLYKIMSKMGIATIDSYCGAQIFEAYGLDEALVRRCLTGTPTIAGKAGFTRFGKEIALRHRAAWIDRQHQLPHPGQYKFKKDGEPHALNPSVVHALQKAVRAAGDTNWETGYAAYQHYLKAIRACGPIDPRDLLEFSLQPSIPLDEVEPIDAIVKRFSTAAISHGSLSREAHELLAEAMNALGGMSNSGEGGEDPSRFNTNAMSAVKQIASGRFGVTPAYLMHARELQIKMAQGSKPGEGGQIPGNKVSEEIAAIRHTTPGVALISPPPHHDIYSIEDLAQLISDLHVINPTAAVSVKLVAERGVGTIAAGVVKGGADVVLISGHSGGTGASPLSSIKNVGLPWEIGLAETQQTLVLNDLRGRVRLRVDGGLRTGRDVVVAALLGADEFSFGTTALIAEGCVMARACHNNTCPVGIATQRPDLRAKFPGKVEHVMAFMQFIAQEIRELLASLGARTLDEIIGRVDLLQTMADAELDLSGLLGDADPSGQRQRRWNREPRPYPLDRLNQAILDAVLPALQRSTPATFWGQITNQDRTTATALAGHLAMSKFDGRVELKLIGSAGQSFGAWATKGMFLHVIGEANDYVGKGLAGGEIVIRPPESAQYVPNTATIVGNTVLYGATGGMLFAAGRAGERFAVRNSGAIAVVEGLGDHGCEYMTGGTVVVLGPTGSNFAAGMTGGTAFVYDPDATFIDALNDELVKAERVASPLIAEHLRGLIERHSEQTNSPLAAALLNRWQQVQGFFWHITPQAAVQNDILPVLEAAVRAA